MNRRVADTYHASIHLLGITLYSLKEPDEG